jgi:hypothetical protein
MSADLVHAVYVVWVWSFPSVAAASFWWWETRRESNRALRRSFLFSAAASLPGAMLWNEHVTRELAFLGGLRRLAYAYEYGTMPLAFLSIPVVLLVLIGALIRRPFVDAPLGANLVQALHVVWSLVSMLVALYFASGV